MTSIAASVEWLVVLVSGPLATLILSIAVVMIGYLMLFGQFPARRAVLTILGGFILIGSAQIAQSMILAVQSSQPQQPLPAPNSLLVPERVLGEPTPRVGPHRGNPFDPYSGTESVN